MAKRKAQSKPKRRRRTHSEEFKREAAKLVLDQQLSVSEAARNLGIHPNLLRTWKERFEAEHEDTTLTEDERREIARLRSVNRTMPVRNTQYIYPYPLKKAAAFFANEKN